METIRNKKILIVEDDKLLADLLIKRLRDEGMTVNFINNGEEIFHILENEIPDLIVLDLLLPGEGGMEVLSKLKTNENFKSIPIILISNLQLEKDIQKAKELGVVSFISKSKTDLETMTREIENILKN